MRVFSYVCVCVCVSENKGERFGGGEGVVELKDNE